MFENHGAYICPSPAESYLTNAERPHPSVYRLHFRSAGSDPYTTTKALLRSPKSFLTANPILSSSTDSISPMDFLTGSSLLINILISMSSPLICHLFLSPSLTAPFSVSTSEMTFSASAGLYLKLNVSSCSITVRYSGSDGP